MSHPRVVFMGMEGVFSHGPLVALLGAGYPLSAVVIPRAASAPGGAPVRVLPRHGMPYRRALPLLGRTGTPPLAALAGAAGVPVLEIERPDHPAVLAALGHLEPTIIAVACFPWLLPRALLRLPALGALNVHPSLLPAYRGPAPLFWIFHDGLEQAGVTVHLMTARADAGPIVAQRPLLLPDGIAYAEAERLLSREGGQLLCRAIDALHTGTAQAREQALMAVPPAPVPVPADLLVTSDWPARRAFNFLRGMQGRPPPLVVLAGGRRIVARAAEAYDATATLPVAVQLLGGSRVIVRCSPGTLTLTTHS